MANIDSILFVSFGGPEQPDDVLPFLRRVTAGRNVPEERLVVVAKQYELFGGRSPINEQTRALIEATQKLLTESGVDLPIYWGNRNWHPFLEDALQQMAADGMRRAVAFVTSAYSSYSSCRQYLENIAAAQIAVGPNAPTVHKIGQFYDHAGFVEPFIENTRKSLMQFDVAPALVFTAHSIPLSMAEKCRYQSQLLETAEFIATAVGIGDWSLAFQSRSGAPHVPWLEPDINDHLRALHANGTTNVAVAPIGFISDHLEVMYDLDVQARATADELGIHMERVATPGLDGRFVSMVAELITREIKGDNTNRCLGETCCLV